MQVTDYEEEYSSYLEQEEGVLVWSLTITRVTPDMAGFYQCEVRLLTEEDYNWFPEAAALTTP